MLQLKKISKKYTAEAMACVALDHVSLDFRDSEFVAVLGPSGSGKTTLLNVIGGLDRYDDGELLINGVSTKNYKERDWDTYRNHTVGFVFQSYNLIPHQTVLANVELALTIGGISAEERRERARTVLCRVGLDNQMNKKPNQLSGGQMQRVAIARALVNDPDIVLADEPTGALDSDTGIQVMELLKEVAKDRLVVMVTHNPELADSYATRIVRLQDGRIVADTDPVSGPEEKGSEGRKRLSSMSWATALSLSFSNLKTKKGRTLLTAFAGSIGIIGIALILALSDGVGIYIDGLQAETMTSYPITIDAQTLDLASIYTAGKSRQSKKKETEHPLDGVYSDGSVMQLESQVMSSLKNNNMTAFKAYLDDPDSEIHKYVDDDGIVCSYETPFSIYTYDPDGLFVNADGSTLMAESVTGVALEGFRSMMQAAMVMAETGRENTEQLLPGTEGEAVGEIVTDNYDLLYGKWPQEYDEAVLVVNEDSEITTNTLYEIGILPTAEYRELRSVMGLGSTVQDLSRKLEYDEICSKEYFVVPECDTYLENTDGTFSKVTDFNKIQEIAGTEVRLRIVGVICPNEDLKSPFIKSSIAYTEKLTRYLIEYAENSSVVKAQRATPEIDVTTGQKYVSEALMEANLLSFGAVSEETPSEVRIYVDSFEDKDGVSASIEKYNEEAALQDQITYTDYVGLLTTSVTRIIDVISWILIAFVAVSLVVSSIMIGIVTYISVLERTREIGILRALGSSRSNISQVFNAETFIIGLISGLIGIAVSYLLLIPINMIIHAIAQTNEVNAVLAPQHSLILILLSVVLTLIGGWIPSRKAACMDPVAALRTE